MPKNKSQKDSEVKKLQEQFALAKTAVFLSYTGLNVKDAQILRNNLRQEGAAMIASKKTLLKKALAQSGLEVDADKFSGSLAVAFGAGDEVAPAKVLAKFGKDKEAIKIQGGLLEGKFISVAKVLELAKLPSRLELLAKTAAAIKAPLTGLVNVLAGNLRGLVNVLNSIKESKINSYSRQ